MSNLDTRRNHLRKEVLDCETPELAQKSVASILEVELDELLKHLRQFKFGPKDSTDKLLSSILDDKKSTWGFSSTAWFHLTRCKPSESFERGLLPLPDVIEQLWDFLFDIQSKVDKATWDIFRGEVEEQHLYRIRIHNLGLGQNGPYGVLVGDLSFNAAIAQDHYLHRGPEIVILICDEFYKKFNYALQDDYIRQTKPCIVKFETDTAELSHLLAAINYVYELEQSAPTFYDLHSDCYNGCGESIKSMQIKKIDFIKI